MFWIGYRHCLYGPKVKPVVEVYRTGEIKEAVLWKDPYGYELKADYAKEETESENFTERTQRLEIRIIDALRLLGATSLDGHVSGR